MSCHVQKDAGAAKKAAGGGQANVTDARKEMSKTKEQLNEEMKLAAVRAAVAASIPGLDEEAIELRTLAFWSAIYGFASMRRKGVIRPVPGSVSGAMIADKLAEAIAERAIVAALAP